MEKIKKDTAIKDGNTAESDQLATIEQMTALEESTIQQIADLNTELDETDQALTDATNLRAEQRAKYEKKHTDTVNSVEGVRSAIADISAATSFVQKDAVLKSAKVVALVQEAEKLRAADPGDKSREHAGLGASASITEILDLLLDDWSQKAKKMEDEETARKDLFDQKSAELRQMITDTKTAIANAEIKLSDTKATNAATKGQLTETKANLHDDTKYLKDLTAQCEEKAKEWDQRSAMRAGEIKALTEAIDIVGGSVASTQGTRGYTDNTAFLQGGAPPRAPENHYTDVIFTQLKEVKKAGESERAKQMRLDAVTKITHMAAELKSGPLNLLAMRIAADPFAKVKELIQQLITRLLTESQNEATQKGWCDTKITHMAAELKSGP